MRVTITVNAETFKDAQALAKEHGRQSLEGALAGLAYDMAEAYRRPGSWEADRVYGWLASHYGPPEFLCEPCEQAKQGGDPHGQDC